MAENASEAPAIVEQRQLYELAGVVAERIQIIDIILANTKASRRPGADFDLRKAELSTDVSTKCSASEERKGLSVIASFSLQASAKDAERPFLTMEAEFVLLYAVKNMDGLTEKHFDAFAKANGVFNAWPFWREYVHSMTQRMGLGKLVIPVFRVTGKRPPGDDNGKAQEAAAAPQPRLGGRKKG